MTTPSPATPQPVLLFSRLLLASTVVLVLIAGVQLYVLSAYTEQFFAWTIALPLSAALIGAGFWSALVPAAVALRQRYWVGFRSNLPPAITATGLILLATLLHLDKFHLTSGGAFARFAGWVWLAVYVIVPPAFILGSFLQLFSRGQNPPARRDVPVALLVLHSLQAAFGLLVGGALFLLPEALMPAWGWALTPLTARALGAWLTAYGVGALTVVAENDRARVRGEVAGLLTFGVLQLLALIRFAGSVEWGRPATWLYVLFLLSVIGTNLVGVLLRPRTNTAA